MKTSEREGEKDREREIQLFGRQRFNDSSGGGRHALAYLRFPGL